MKQIYRWVSTYLSSCLVCCAAHTHLHLIIDIEKEQQPRSKGYEGLAVFTS